MGIFGNDQPEVDPNAAPEQPATETAPVSNPGQEVNGIDTGMPRDEAMTAAPEGQQAPEPGTPHEAEAAGVGYKKKFAGIIYGGQEIVEADVDGPEVAGHRLCLMTDGSKQHVPEAYFTGARDEKTDEAMQDRSEAAADAEPVV